jgi:hypothetical protein
MHRGLLLETEVEGEQEKEEVVGIGTGIVIVSQVKVGQLLHLGMSACNQVAQEVAQWAAVIGAALTT